MPAPKSPPVQRTVSNDLTDAEFAELDEMLANTPEPLEPVDAVMLDGFLCGVLVQPVLLQPDAWLAHVFDFEARSLPDEVDPAWRDRATTLVLRRHAALNRALAEDGWFDPLGLEYDVGEASPEEIASASETNPFSQALMPWVAGFQHAMLSFPDLSEMAHEDVTMALARLYRHLPADTPEEREVVATLDRESPLATLDDAMEELVACVADLYDLTRDQRYHVDTVKRDAPKVGRNDPCPCASGKKFKQCHGAG